MLENISQPSLQSVVQRMSHELSAKAVILLHSSGQIIAKSGWMEEENFPTIAALVAAMASAGSSLGALGDEEGKGEIPTRFSCESESIGLYSVAVNEDFWLATLYDQPLNPGLFRMKVRRYAATMAGLGVNLPKQWQSEGASQFENPGVKLPPANPASPTLFENITDDEIDNLFGDVRS